MEPIPESTLADDWFGPFFLDDQDLLPRLRSLGRSVVRLVPECVGLSVSLVEHGATFTVASSDPEILLLDAVQYADDGPCLEAIRSGDTLGWVEAESEGGAERRWHALSLASAALGIRSTLSLPIVRDGETIGGYNLYAGTPDAFDGHHDEIAALLGAWAGGATTNADLGFSTRDEARRAPEQLRDSTRLTVAGALLARASGFDAETAVDRLRQAAVQAAVPLPSLVESIIVAFQGPEG